jgi:hypothetical protein
MNIPSSKLSSDITSKLISTMSTSKTAKTDGDSDKVKSTESVAPPAQGMSKMAELMKKLDELQASDPEKFKSVTAEIGKKLLALANSATGSDAERLQDLASKFTQASESGSMAALRPQQHQPHARGVAAYAQQQRLQPPANDSNLRGQIDSIIEQALSP